MNIIHTAEVDRGYFSIRELHGVYYLHMKAPLQKEQCITLTKAQFMQLFDDMKVSQAPKDKPIPPKSKVVSEWTSGE